MGRAVATETELIDIARVQARRFILFDMADMAAKRHSVISAVLLGAIAGSSVLPFKKEAFEGAIRRSGLAVETNLAAFEDAFHAAAAGSDDEACIDIAARNHPGDLPAALRHACTGESLAASAGVAACGPAAGPRGRAALD